MEKTIAEKLEESNRAIGRNRAFQDVCKIIKETLEERGNLDTFLEKWSKLIRE